MKTHNKKYLRHISLVAICSLLFQSGCRHIELVKNKQIELVKDRQEDFDLGWNVYSNKITVSIVNYSSKSMFLKINPSNVSYYMAYTSATNHNDVVFIDNRWNQPFGLYFNSWRILFANPYGRNENMIHPYSIFFFEIKKPDDFIELLYLEVLFEAFPIENEILFNDYKLFFNSKQWLEMTESMAPEDRDLE